MANDLNLKPRQTESITISGFGKSNKNVRQLEIATIQMKTQSAEMIPIDVQRKNIDVNLNNCIKYIKKIC